jgi:predicted CoA-substrate-specific enzyme activase
MKLIGLDAGSVTVKIVVFDNEINSISYKFYERHKGYPVHLSYKILSQIIDSNKDDYFISVTGSAGRLIAKVLGIEPVNEIVAQAIATRKLFPHIRTIIEMGGEDSKLILLGEGEALIQDFSMNSVCAAGTGSFLDQQAERLRLTIEEFSELTLKSKKPPRIAGRCSVFAKSDMIHLQQIATPMEDIVAGLCFAVARNFKGCITRGRKLIEPVSFQGGVAANKGMIRAFKEVFGLSDLFIPEDFALMCSIGAVIKNELDGLRNILDIERLKEFLKRPVSIEEGYPQLSNPKNILKDEKISLVKILSGDVRRPIEAYMGIDVGSISTNLAVIDEKGNLLAKRYLMTAGRPIEAVNQGLSEIGEEIGDKVRICGVGTTGSGRYMIADYVGADVVKNEITAQATAAVFIDKNVDTIFEIGGQDSKFIALQDGIIIDFEMNKACAAGTGSFLEEQAEKLNISIKGEFEELALSAKNPCRLGERCTVFMENSLMANLQKGVNKNDLLAGLAYSIVQNYINRVVAGKRIGNNIFFQGGVAFNKSVVAAFEKYLGKKIIVPPHHDVTGAIGMALIAMWHMKKHPELKTTFKGFELSKRPYEITSFECKGCPNVCEINRVKISGEEGYLFYGGRCEKYDIKRKKITNMENLFLYREEMLWKKHLELLDEYKGKQRRGIKIGIPYIFFFQDFLPYWSTLLWELGFEVEVSPKTNRQIINYGIEHVLSEACFPIKVAHGHIGYLIEKDVDYIFLPSFINLNSTSDEMDRGLACPHTQTIPYVTKIAFEKFNALTPVVNLGRGKDYLVGELYRVFKHLGVRKSLISKAIEKAEDAQEEFITKIKNKGEEVLANIKDNIIVLVGRSYNASDNCMNLELPRKLAELGVLSIPMDFLPIERYCIKETWPNMYWRSGQRILKAARMIREYPKLNAIYVGNFLCGPDSFVLKYFKKEMGEKPFLHIEIDEHSADTGIITRCEAFLDSLSAQKAVDLKVRRVEDKSKFRSSSIVGHSSRTIYIPRMADHAFALAAAFQRCGINAEVLPESDKESIELGKKFVSGKECYPCAVTTGDMVKKVLSSDFIPEKSAFFMPSGTGPCRFGQYNVFHRMVLDSLGYPDVPIFAPNQDTTFYKDLGIVGKDFTMAAWKGIIAYELLLKCLHETRPYEKNKGSAEEIYRYYVNKLYETLREDEDGIERILLSMRKDFESLPLYREKKPLIGIVGEIFVRSHKFSNENLVKKIEALGAEAWLAPVEEWIYYVNYVGFKKALLKKEKSAIINFLLKRYFQKKIEHKYAAYFKGFLKTLHEPDTKEVIEKASPYVHKSFEGETILSIGKSVDLIEKGASGIVNAMPFGCMPGTIVTALLRGINKRFGVPYISIPYDGTESLTVMIQLEAFIDQAKNFNSLNELSKRKFRDVISQYQAFDKNLELTFSQVHDKNT